MPREVLRKFQENSLTRREHEDSPWFRPHEVTPLGMSRFQEQLWEREHLEQLHMRMRSRSPHDERRRSRNTPRLSMDCLRSDPFLQDLIPPPRNHERDVILRSSPRLEISRAMLDSTYSPPGATFVDGRFSNTHSLSWTDPKQDIASTPTTLEYRNQYQNNQLSGNTVESPIIPEFNPESGKLNSTEWIQLLEATAIERGWRPDEKLYIFTSRLSGFARQWYLTSGVTCKTWSKIKDGFLKAFPSELEYYALLKKMLARVKQNGETISAYVLHKVSLLNACDIQGVKAVSCIIAGLPSSKLKEQARMEKCVNPDQLYLFLREFTKEDFPNPGNKNADPSKTELKPDNYNATKDCYFCGNTGHFVINCPSIIMHECSVCHVIGHECEPLVSKEKTTGHNQVMEGALSHKEVQKKCFTEVFLNGIIFNAYVDLNSECITIKERDAMETRLPIKKQYKLVRGFAGAALSSVGYIDTSISIDRAMAHARLFVVPDHLQSVPIVIGQSFTQQPHVVILKDGGKIRFHQGMDNGDTNLDF